MAYRTFVDDHGVAWQVWDVHPAHVERRAADRRRQSLPFAGPDRRTGTDRRRRRETRVSLGPDLTNGWLAFHSAHEKRRYSPIPEGWFTYSVHELTRVCSAANVVRDNIPSRGVSVFTSSEYHAANHEAKTIDDAATRRDALDAADDAGSTSAA